MKIALYHPWIYVKSGLERTILEIVKRSRHTWILYTSHYDREGTYPELKQYAVREISRVSVKRQYGTVATVACKIAAAKIDMDRVDALAVCCDGLGSFITVRNRRRPVVNICFTPLRAAYDPEYRKRHLEQHAGKRMIALWIERLYKSIDRILWKNYSRVVCISRTVKERVIDANLYPFNRIDVAYPGISGERIGASGAFEPFFFLPGRIMWTKNLELGIEGFRQFRAAAPTPFQLIIAGMVDEKSRDYYRRLKCLAGDGGDVVFCVNPSDEMMQQRYKSCYGVLFTAFNEDLGLTPMEAMMHGKPVIAVNRGGPREVLEHNRTGLLMPDDVNSFALAMRWLVENPEQARKMGEAGMKRVERFTWKHYVESLDDIMDELIDSRTGTRNNQVL